jgi:hypothetical protein
MNLELDQNRFVEYLKNRQLDEETISNTLKDVTDYFVFTQTHPSLDHQQIIDLYLKTLIQNQSDSYQKILSLARYGRFSIQNELYQSTISLLDGGEVMQNLSIQLEKTFGKSIRDKILKGVSIPSWGIDNQIKAKVMHQIMKQIESILDPSEWKPILSACLRDLPEASYEPSKKSFQSIGNLEDWLEKNKEDFLQEMKHLMETGELYFNQPITEKVYRFLLEHEEISKGILKGNQLFITKIPYLTDEWLKEKDPVRKSYLYCHCPWVRESLLGNPAIQKVSSNFCYCSAGFVKKEYEVMFGQKLEFEIMQTISKGDPVCQFAISIPEQFLTK